MILKKKLNKVVSILIFYKHKILLQLRDINKSIPYPGKWGFISGNIETCESPLFAAKRELHEELLIKNFKNVNFLYNFLSRKNENIMYHVFTLNLQNKAQLKLKEGIEYSFFSKIDFLKGYKYSKELKKICFLADNPVMKKFYFKSLKI
mgnify:CR=1 FL=1|jgi:ADP-ribose pyrophosphatase YjhB (NUDIX family)